MAGFDSLDEAAMPFITVTDEDKFEINPEAVRYLKTLTGRVAVVSIAGKGGVQASPRVRFRNALLPLQASTARASRTC